MSLGRRSVGVVVLALFIVGVGSVVWWRGASRRQVNAPRARDIAIPQSLDPLLRTQAQPNPFSDELEPVIASIDEEWRRRIILTVPEELRLIFARCSSALVNPRAFQGDPQEVEIALESLDIPIENPLSTALRSDPPGEDIDGTRRSAGLCVLRVAALSGVSYPAIVVERMADAAARHINWQRPSDGERAPIRMESAAILLALNERGLLNDEQEAVLEAALADEGLRFEVQPGLRDLGMELPPP